MATLSLILKGRTAHSFTFVDANVSTSAETITKPGHGLRPGQRVTFSNSGGALPGNIVSGWVYFVRAPTASTFQLATTLDGSAVNISSASGGGTHTLKSLDTFADIVGDASNDRATLIGVINYLKGCLAGTESASFDLHVHETDPVAASMTYTLSSVPADDTVVIAGVTLTAKASPSGEAQWSQGGTDAEDATALAACINAHSTLRYLVSASASGAVVTVTAKVKGQLGNLITSTESGTSITASSATLTGGTGGPAETAVSYGFGK